MLWLSSNLRPASFILGFVENHQELIIFPSGCDDSNSSVNFTERRIHIDISIDSNKAHFAFSRAEKIIK